MPKLKPTPISFDHEAPTVKAAPPVGMREEAVRAGVLKALGRPPELLRVAVMPLWNDYFRVNVYTGANSAAGNIPISFFVTADADGKILQAVPAIRKLY